MTEFKKRSIAPLAKGPRSGAAREDTTTSTVKLGRRVAPKGAEQTAVAATPTAKALTVSGKMVLHANQLKPFRGFTQTPEEGQQLARTSFTDTPLLRRIVKK